MNSRRIIAWILLIGFVLLLVNILFIGYELFISGFIYIAIAGVFLLTMSRRKSGSDAAGTEAEKGNEDKDGHDNNR